VAEDATVAGVSSVERTWVDVDLAAIGHNIEVLRRAVAPAGVVAVVKADGYGHGASPVAAAAVDAGATGLAVAITAEGALLRDDGITARTLVLAEPRPDEMAECVSFGLEPAVYTSGGVVSAAKAAADRGHRLAVHLKVDTGMHRVGASPTDAVALAEAVVREPALELASVWTHCAAADEPGSSYTADQLARFDAVLADLAGRDIRPRSRHAANSAAAVCHPASRYDFVRAGIATYGIPPSPALADQDDVADLRRALTWTASVSFVKTVAAGEGISYGLRHHFDRDTVVATIPVGYADGVPRRLHATGGEILLGGRRRRIVGVVTMDQVMVDCGPPEGRGDADGAVPAAGDEAVLLGRQGGEAITPDEWAARLDTIAYEIVCGIGPRVPRRYP
jgi:alanine racemase